MQRVRRRQLEFAFAVNPPNGGRSAAGVLGVPEAKAWLRPIAKAKGPDDLTAEVTDTGRLLERIASGPIMAQALLNVAANKGSAGEDGQPVEEVVSNVRSLLPKLQHALLTGNYRPGDVRRVWIPKPGGKGQRGLGIPNVIDRWVQEATRLVLEPIFDPLFHDSSHGFRSKRGPQTAIAEAKRYVEEGHSVVVDLDLSKFESGRAK